MPKINYAAMFHRRQDGRYAAQYYDDDGKRHYLYDTDAEKLFYKLQAAQKPKVKDFSALADEWKDYRFPQLAYKTVEAYTPIVERIKDRFGEDSPTNITPQEISAFLKWLAGRGYAKRTVQMHRDITSQIFNYGIQKGTVQINPCDHIALPRGLQQGTRGIPDDDAIQAVMCGLDAPFGLFAYLLIYSGLRRGEALALRYDDIDRKNSVIHVTKSVQYIGNTPSVKEPKTKNSVRDVILLDTLADAIPKNEKGYIFRNSKGEIMSRSTYTKKWKQYCKAIGYEITAHQLRHGYATILYEAGVADKDAQELLGHADITLTRNIYTHIRNTHKNDVRKILNDFTKSR